MAENSDITYYGVIPVAKERAFSEVTCPKCGEPAFPGGVFLVSPVISIGVPIPKVKLWFIEFGGGERKIAFSVQYCPKCGFLAVRDFKL